MRWLIFGLTALALVHWEAYGQINSPGARTLFARSWMYRSGVEVTVTGFLHPSHGDKSPGLTVEKFE
ncbi:MAG: hypothetical protein HY652_05020 [Acidobacteria bacterium]|nr:hypothetical protein [Acidobacteriota bacterium]